MALRAIDGHSATLSTFQDTFSCHVTSTPQLDSQTEEKASSWNCIGGSCEMGLSGLHTWNTEFHSVLRCGMRQCHTC